MRNLMVAVLLLIGIAMPSLAESKPTTKGSIVGSWFKERTQQEDHKYPEDANWDIAITYQSDGRFVWRATHKENSSDKERTDASAKGTYSVKGYLVTYQFDNPSPQALKHLPKFFAFWPKQLRGQQTFQFQDDTLRLGNDGSKLWMFFKHKSEKAEGAQPSSPKSDKKAAEAPQNKDK